MISGKVSYYEFGKCRLDIENHQLLKDGERIFLAQKTFEILSYFVKNRGRVLKKEELLETFWEEEYLEETLIAQQIYRIRKAIKHEETGENYIETIPKYGYRFTAEVKEKIALPGFDNKSLGEHNVSTRIDVDAIETARQSYTPRNGFHQDANQTGDYSPSNKAQSPRSQRTWLLWASGLIITLGAVLAFTYVFSFKNSTDFSSIKSIAVLPFTQIGEDQNEKLGLGLADALISKFSNQRKISVSPTNSIVRFAYNGTHDPIEIGKKLEVDAVLNGTIQRERGVARINVQLVSVKDRIPIWADKFDVKFTSIFSLQDLVADIVTQKLPLQISNVPKSTSIVNYTGNPQALQAYWMGFSYWTLHSSTGFENAIKQFDKAIEQDPDFVLAYAYLADSYGHNLHISHLISKEDALSKGKKAAQRALELDPNCAEALAALALIYTQERRSTEAFNSIKKSLELKPSDAHARHRLSWIYASMNNMEKAVEEAKYARNLDPQSTYLNLFLAKMLYFAEQPDKSKTYLQKTLEIEPNSLNAKWNLVKVLEQSGEYLEAEKTLREIEKVVRGPFKKKVKLMFSRLYLKTRKTKEAREILEEILIKENESDDLSFLVGTIYIALGEENLALQRMKDVVGKLDYDNFYHLKYEPNLASFRKNPAFIKLLEEKGKVLGW